MPYYQCCAIYPHMLAVEQPTSSGQTWWLARPLVKWITLRHTPVNRLPEEDAQAARHRMAFPPHWLVCQHQHEFRSWEFLRTKLQPFLGPTTSRKDSCATMCLHHQQNSHGWQMVTDCIVCIYIYIQSIASTPSIFHFFTEFGPVCVCSNMFQRGTRWWNVAKSPADRPDRWAGALLSCSMFLASLSDIEKWSTYLRCAYTWEEFQDFYAKTHSNKVGSLRCFCLNKRDENTREEPSRIPKLD